MIDNYFLVFEDDNPCWVIYAIEEKDGGTTLKNKVIIYKGEIYENR